VTVHNLFVYQDRHVKEETEDQPTTMNAFELISLNQALNLENLFEAKKVRYDSAVLLHGQCYVSIFYYILVNSTIFWKLQIYNDPTVKQLTGV